MSRRQSPASKEETAGGMAASAAMSAYAEALQNGEFQIQCCGDCHRHIFYPRAVCPHCASIDLRWVAPRGTGTVYSTTVVRRPADKGGPYNVAIVELDEGVRLMSRVDHVAPEAVRIGLRVQVQVATVDGAPAPVFTPFDSGARE